MDNVDLLDFAVRQRIIEEIGSTENLSRKRFEQRKFDIFRNRQAQYVLERLRDELGVKSVESMRKVLSINPLPRIIDEQASLYKNEPERFFSNVNEAEEETLESLYKYGHVDKSMRLANKYYKLHDQAFLYLVPNDGQLCPRVLTPKDLDVIPDANNPEKAYAYILNVWNLQMNSTFISQSAVFEGAQYYGTDNLNQKIADQDDRDALYERYVVWTNDLHFTMNGYGEIVGEVVANPIGEVPFIDISTEKDFSFFVSRGNQAAEFVIDLLAQMSDLANVARLQGYSQAIIYSAEEPKDIRVGPAKVIWLKLDPNNPDARPEFTFESPSPDLNAGLEIINSQLKMFLTSVGLDASVVSGKDQQRAFTSGVDHLLSNLDKFQASKQDMDLFRSVEDKLFKLMVLWNNIMQPVSGEGELDEHIKGVSINQNAAMEIRFAEPTDIQTRQSKEDSVIKLLDAGLMSKSKAMQELYGFDEAKALEELAEIDKESAQLVEAVAKMQPEVIEPETEDVDGETEGIS